jgi:hypothetical protein
MIFEPHFDNLNYGDLGRCKLVSKDFFKAASAVQGADPYEKLRCQVELINKSREKKRDEFYGFPDKYPDIVQLYNSDPMKPSPELVRAFRVAMVSDL